MLLQCLKQCFSSLCVLKMLKSLVRILSCTTLISVGPCYLLHVLAVYVFTASSCVRVLRGVEILRGPFPSCCVLPLSWYAVHFIAALQKAYRFEQVTHWSP